MMYIAQKKDLSLLKLIRLFIAVMVLASLTFKVEAATTTPNPYENADLLLSSVIGHMQYPIPANVTENQQTHLLDFSKAVATPDSPWKDEVRFVAAYSFCQRLAPLTPTAPHGTAALTTSDIQALADHNNVVAARSAAMEMCMAAVTYRMACPANNSNATMVGGGMDCHTAQVAMCNYLKKPAGKGGMGITSLSIDGKSEADNALADCDTVGLSSAMYDKILAHRCDSTAYVQNLTNIFGGVQSMIEHTVQFECQSAKDAFDAKMDREREGILIAIQTLLQLRGLGSEYNPIAGPTGQN